MIWDGVEDRVNCGSAMEKPGLLSVSENEGYERERERDDTGDKHEAALESLNSAIFKI